MMERIGRLLAVPWLACSLPVLCAAVLYSADPPAYYAKVGVFIGLGTLQAMSLNMIWGLGGQFSMGQMMLTAIGAYVSALAVTLYGVDPYLTLLPLPARRRCWTSKTSPSAMPASSPSHP